MYKEKQNEQRANDAITKNLLHQLLRSIEGKQTVPDLLDTLKELTNITNGASTEAYSKLFWSVKLKSLPETPDHVDRFEDIMRHLDDNQSMPDSKGLKQAFLTSIQDVMPQLAETLENNSNSDYSKCRTKVLQKASAAIVRQLLQDDVKKDRTPWAHYSNSREDSLAGNKRHHQHTGVGSRKQVRNYKSLNEVPNSTIMAWEEHRQPDYTFRFQQKCWFKVENPF